MSEPANVKDTLEATILSLRTLRKSIALAGHIEALYEIDTLLHVTQAEAEKLLIHLISQMVAPPHTS